MTAKRKESGINAKRFAKYFKAFGDTTRLKILSLLADKELTVNEIVAAVGLSQSAVSRHLGILREAEVVFYRREGQKVYYSLNREAVGNCCCGFCDCLEVPVIGVKKKKK